MSDDNMKNKESPLKIGVAITDDDEIKGVVTGLDADISREKLEQEYRELQQKLGVEPGDDDQKDEMRETIHYLEDRINSLEHQLKEGIVCFPNTVPYENDKKQPSKIVVGIKKIAMRVKDFFLKYIAIIRYGRNYRELQWTREVVHTLSSVSPTVGYEVSPFNEEEWEYAQWAVENGHLEYGPGGIGSRTLYLTGKRFNKE